MPFIDVNESRDRRLQMLLQTATQVAQLKQQRDMAQQEQQYRMAQLTQQSAQQDTSNQLQALKAGYVQPSPQQIPRLMNEANMRSNPNPMQTIGGRGYVPSVGAGGGQPVFTVDNEGNLVQSGMTPKGSKVFKKSLTPEEISGREGAKVTEQQKAFKEPEINYLGALGESRNTISDLRMGLEELGVKDPSKFGVIEEETINSEFGPISIPARFNLVGQYSKDPKYTAMKRKMDRFFNQYRKVITGAQASYQELEALKEAVGSFKDRPGVFFANLGEMEKEMDKALNIRLDLYDDVGRDTSRVRKRYQKNEGMDLDTVNKLVASSGLDLGGATIKNVRIREKK